MTLKLYLSMIFLEHKSPISCKGQKWGHAGSLRMIFWLQGMWGGKLGMLFSCFSGESVKLSNCLQLFCLPIILQQCDIRAVS